MARRYCQLLLTISAVILLPKCLGCHLKSCWFAGCCDPWNDKALKASRGAHLSFPLAQGSMDALLSVLGTHGLHALAAAVPSPECPRPSQQSPTGSPRLLDCWSQRGAGM